MNQTNYIFHLLISLSLLLASCGGVGEENGSEELRDETEDLVQITNAQYNTAGIELGYVEMRTLSGTIPASGMLDVPPQSKVSVSAPMGGFVKSTSLLQGSRVEKGQVVAVMQHQDYIQIQQDYLENISQLGFLKSEYERQEILARENVNAIKSLEQSKANYFSMKGTVEGIKSRLQMLNINPESLEKGNIQPTINLYSPISGYVTKVNTNIGAFVHPTDVLFEIVNTQQLHVELTIFEKDVPLLKVNQRVLFTLANETTPRMAYVHLIGREINANRNVQVHCEIEKQDRELIPGMYLKAIVETDSAHVTSVPDEAIAIWQGRKYIFTEKEITLTDKYGEKTHIYIMNEVTTGSSEAGYTEVHLPEGFDMSRKIVTRGAFNLLAKLKNTGDE